MNTKHKTSLLLRPLRRDLIATPPRLLRPLRHDLIATTTRLLRPLRHDLIATTPRLLRPLRRDLIATPPRLLHRSSLFHYALSIIAAVMLFSCHTSKSALTSDYDEQPENKQPVLERPAWPNYDLHDDRSFAAFSHVQTAPKGEGVNLIMEDGSTNASRTTLYRCKDATYLCFDFDVPEYQDWWFFRENSGSAIIDADTGDRYVVQSHIHFPLDQCFWIYGHKNETIRLICKYPPLPLSVKRVQIYSASSEARQWMSGDGSVSKAYDLDDLRPRPKKQAKEKPKKQGRIIR